MNLGTLVKWIQKNKKKRAFFGYSDDLVAQEIVEAMANGVFCYHINNSGQLVGVVCGVRDDLDKSVFIHDVLTTEKGVLNRFMERFLLLFPCYTIKGQCNKQDRNFDNPVKLKQRLEAYGRK